MSIDEKLEFVERVLHEPQFSLQETTELNSKEDIKHIFDRFILKKMSQSSIISVEKNKEEDIWKKLFKHFQKLKHQF